MRYTVKIFPARISIIFILLLTAFETSYGQLKENYKAEIEAQAIGTTNGVVPFWMRSNKYGSIPNSGLSGSIIGKLQKSYEVTSLSDSLNGYQKPWDWGFGVEGRSNGGKNSNLQLIEAYAKVRGWIFQFKAGRSKDVMGLTGDTLLSSGNFTQSGNAFGVPKVELSIPNYYTLPILDGLFSFKGNFVHGWLGTERILDTISSISSGPNRYAFAVENTHPTTYFHQKSLYARLGKQDWRLKLYGGFNHQVFWGNEDEIYESWKLSPFKSFLYVITGKTYATGGVPQSKIGNQIGSIDLAVEYEFNNVKVKAYRQAFYDVGALSKLANIADGLNGVSFENLDYENNDGNFNWQKIIFEVFYSKDQAGYPWSIPTKSGDEDYYNNFFYLDGWSYNGLGLGSPLITPRNNAKKGQKYQTVDYFINNRLVAYHIGIKGDFLNWQYSSKVTFSRNYGTFGTSKYGNSTGKIRAVNRGNIFVPVNQLSIYLDASKHIKENLILGFELGLDNGKLLDNSFGAAIKLKKTF